MNAAQQQQLKEYCRALSIDSSNTDIIQYIARSLNGAQHEKKEDADDAAAASMIEAYQRKVLFPKKMEIPDGQFPCHTCKRAGRPHMKTTDYQMQTRGADEAMTTFVKCHICGKEWKK